MVRFLFKGNYVYIYVDICYETNSISIVDKWFEMKNFNLELKERLFFPGIY